jgi:ATP-dependent exoDNAse (exonuclease V) alpha subunit
MEQALQPGVAVQLTSDGLESDPLADRLVHEPARPLDGVRRRSNGESVLHEHGTTRYTTQDLLDAERRLLTYAAQPTKTGLSPTHVLELMGSFEDRYDVTLDAGQRALVLGFVSDPRRLVVGIGPAGAGKTTAMRAVAEAWRTTGRRVIPLAPSATAAEVLGAELGGRAENLHKFRHTHNTAPTGRPEDPWFVLEPGDLVLVDEAGMAGTRNLDWLTHYARERGAVVRLLGDPAQLTSVEAGGMLRLLAHDAGAVELTDLHRFADPDEATATIAIREGRPEGLDFYRTHNRVHSGSTDAMLEAAYNAWAYDTRAGRRSLLIATSSSDVTALNVRARATRIEAGLVSTAGVELRDGTIAGVGDLIVTRRNQRQLTSRDGTTFVKNGDTWTVQRVHWNGGLTIRSKRHGKGGVRLPRRYVESDVELGYATTAARAQGRTVDTAHFLIDDTTTREALYVAATRGRDGAHLYVQNEHLLGLDAERPPTPNIDATEALAAVLARETSERTATETRRDALSHPTHESARPRQARVVNRPSTAPPIGPSRHL